MRRFQPSYGLPPEEHGDRLPAWTLRLRSACHAFKRSTDPASRQRAREDIWFWVGRLTCDLLSSGETSTPAALDAVRAIMEARTVTM